MEDYRSALTWLSLQPEVDSDRLGVWGTSFSGGHVIHVAAHDPRVKAVVSQVGAMDPGQTVRDQTTPEQFAALQQLLIKERIRHATDGGESLYPQCRSTGSWFRSPNRSGQLRLWSRSSGDDCTVMAKPSHDEFDRGDLRTRPWEVDRTHRAAPATDDPCKGR